MSKEFGTHVVGFGESLGSSDAGETALIARPIRIGVIGPTEMVEKVRGVAAQTPTVTLVTGAYRDESEAPQLYRTLEDQVEVMLFTGAFTYFYTLDQVETKLPTTYVSLTGSSLYRVLLGLRHEHEITNLTIDSLSHAFVCDAYEELGLPADGIKTFEYRSSVDRAAIVAFHQSYYQQGNSTVALTSIRTANEQLARAGIPSYWVTPTKNAIRDALERARYLGESNRSKELQMVVGLVSLDRFDRLGSETLSEVEIQQVRLDFHRALLKEVERVSGFLTSYGGAEYVFFTTRGAFERWSDGMRSLPLLGMVRSEQRTTISLGIGYGLTARQAGTHARVALKRAQAVGGDCGFILLENKHLIGPLHPGPPARDGVRLGYDLRTINPGLLRKVEAAGITAESLARTAAMIRENHLSTFSAQDLAPLLSVTLRTVHRILLKLERLGMVEVAGEETLTRRGRPRRIYKFLQDSLTTSG